MALRNESPPPELTDEDFQYGFIGETAYTKLGCINLIKRIMERLVKYCSECENEKLSDEFDFDDDLCKFMDMTVEPDVLDFVRDFALVKPICLAISTNKSNRFNEILLGILSNFASNDDLCLNITENLEVVQQLISFWSSDCPSFLLECTRLMKMVLRNPTHAPTWICIIKSDITFLPHIIFILKSSISSELLISTIQIVGQLMKLDEELCERWINNELLSAALVARNEAEWFTSNNIDYFHYLIHMFSTIENGVVILISNFNFIYASFNEYLNKICDEEPHLIIINHYHNSLRLILPTIDVVVANMASNEALNLLQSEPAVMDNLVRLVYSCRLQADNPLAQEVYIEISSFFNTIINITHSILKNSETHEIKQIKWLQSVDVGACVPQLQAFLSCCTHNESAKLKLLEITQKLNLTYLYEAMTEMKIK